MSSARNAPNTPGFAFRKKRKSEAIKAKATRGRPKKKIAIGIDENKISKTEPPLKNISEEKESKDNSDSDSDKSSKVQNAEIRPMPKQEPLPPPILTTKGKRTSPSKEQKEDKLKKQKKDLDIIDSFEKLVEECVNAEINKHPSLSSSNTATAIKQDFLEVLKDKSYTKEPKTVNPNPLNEQLKLKQEALLTLLKRFSQEEANWLKVIEQYQQPPKIITPQNIQLSAKDKEFISEALAVSPVDVIKKFSLQVDQAAGTVRDMENYLNKTDELILQDIVSKIHVESFTQTDPKKLLSGIIS